MTGIRQPGGCSDWLLAKANLPHPKWKSQCSSGNCCSSAFNGYQGWDCICFDAFCHSPRKLCTLKKLLHTSMLCFRAPKTSSASHAALFTAQFSHYLMTYWTEIHPPKIKITSYGHRGKYMGLRGEPWLSTLQWGCGQSFLDGTGVKQSRYKAPYSIILDTKGDCQKGILK